jgi:hypothetical protein
VQAISYDQQEPQTSRVDRRPQRRPAKRFACLREGHPAMDCPNAVSPDQAAGALSQAHAYEKDELETRRAPNQNGL